MKKILPKFKNEIEFWHQVLTSGEDYQLLFSVSKKKKFLLKKRKIKHIKKIGFFKKGEGLRIYDKNKKIFKLKKSGFSHF